MLVPDESLPPSEGAPLNAASPVLDEALEEIEDATETTSPAFKQLRLFAAENPMRHRFDREFWKTVPHLPGVYYFRDEAQKLLYVGQSHNLRKRVGSYRHVHPDRHPKRLVRLVHQVKLIEWEVCDSPAAAIERERVLLLELRPGFNRAGVWKPPPWWLRYGVLQEGARTIFCIDLCREADLHATTPPESAMWLDCETAPSGAGEVSQLVLAGPYPSGFRWVHGALVRCLHRQLFPEVPLHALSAGLMGEKLPRSLRWALPGASSAADLSKGLLAWLPVEKDAASPEQDGGAGDLLRGFFAMFPETMPPMERQFWLVQLDVLARFARDTELVKELEALLS